MPSAQLSKFWVKMTHLLKKNITSNHFVKFMFKLASFVLRRHYVIKIFFFIILIKISIGVFIFELKSQLIIET